MPHRRKTKGMGRKIAAGDRRFNYISFQELSPRDKEKARAMYVYKHFPDESYLYPIKADGTLASARRYHE